MQSKDTQPVNLGSIYTLRPPAPGSVRRRACSPRSRSPDSLQAGSYPRRATHVYPMLQLWNSLCLQIQILVLKKRRIKIFVHIAKKGIYVW